MDIDKLTASIKAHEGLRLKPYVDTTGHSTIGYGRNLTNVGISEQEAEYLLGNDIQFAIREAQTQPWWPHVAGNDARARAMCEMVFNMGVGGVRSFARAVAALCVDDFPTAGAEFLASLWGRQLGKRAEILASMIITGCDPDVTV